MNSFLPFEWIVAVRLLREGRIQSLFIIAGVAIGVAVIVFMSALLDGLQGNLFKRVLSSQPHIVLERPRQAARPLALPRAGETLLQALQTPPQRISAIDQWQKMRDEVQRRPDVQTVSPVASGPAFIVRGEVNQAVSLIGIDPDSYFRIVPLPEKIIAGSTRLTGNDMLVGSQLMDDLGVQLGDKLRLVSASGAGLTLTITGVFDLGSRAINERNVYVLLASAQSLVNLTGSVSRLEVTVPEPFDAETVANAITRDTGLKALSWIASNNQFFLGLNAQTMSSQLIRLCVALSVAAGIASVLVVSVVQRSRDIGILRAMGGSRGQVRRVFLIQGALVGLLGSLMGSALAGLLVLGWQYVAKNPDGTPLFPVVLNLSLVLWASLLATLTGLVAAVTPAVRAARLEPVEAIRG